MKILNIFVILKISQIFKKKKKTEISSVLIGKIIKKQPL